MYGWGGITRTSMSVFVVVDPETAYAESEKLWKVDVQKAHLRLRHSGAGSKEAVSKVGEPPCTAIPFFFSWSSTSSHWPRTRNDQTNGSTDTKLATVVETFFLACGPSAAPLVDTCLIMFHYNVSLPTATCIYTEHSLLIPLISNSAHF